MSAPRKATVIVARTAREGQDKRSRQWLQEISKLAAASPGFIQSEIQPPGTQHPNEWVVVYEFATRHDLNGWLASPLRTEMVGRETDFFSGSPREQVLATKNFDDSITTIASFNLRKIDSDAPVGLLDAKSADEVFAEEYAALEAVVASFDGFLRCDLFPAEPGVQDQTVVIFSFDDRTSLDRWLESDERQQALDRIRPLLEEERTLNVVGGFAGWFASPENTPVKTWKSALLILLALYPTALVVGFARELVLPDLPGPAATLIGNAGGVLILSWWLMPVLTARFAQWLRR